MEDEMLKQSQNQYYDNQNKVTLTIKVSRLLKISEAAILLNESEHFLRDLTSREELVPLEVNGQMYFDESDLWDWMYKQNPIMIKNQNPSLDIFTN